MGGLTAKWTLFTGLKAPYLIKAMNHKIEAQEQMAQDIESLKNSQDQTEERVTQLEKNNDELASKLTSLQDSVDEMRDSAIRGEIASGQKTKDVAIRFNMTPSRISQIAPRRKYSNG